MGDTTAWHTGAWGLFSAFGMRVSEKKFCALLKTQYREEHWRLVRVRSQTTSHLHDRFVAKITK